MNTALYLARRLSLSGNGKKSSPALRVAVIAVSLSIAVMLASIAIVEGFKREIRNKIVGFNSHITLYSIPSQEDEQNLVSLTPSLKAILDDTPFITGYTLDTSAPGILKTSSDFKGVYFKGRDNLRSNEMLAESLVEGKIPDFSKPEERNYLLLSQKAASQLNLKAGDDIDTYFITDEVKVRRLRVAGVFNSHFDAYDDIFAYTDLSLVDSIAGLKPTDATSIQISVDDFDRVEEYAQAIKSTLDKAYADGSIYRAYGVQTVMEQGANYFSWLSLLDTNVAVILILMTVVACVTLISGLLILIIDKFQFIAMMKSLGASDKLLRRVFIYMAMRVAAIGLTIGNALMLLMLWVQYKWQVIPLDPESYYIDFVPVELTPVPLIVLNVAVLAVIFLTMILPAHYVATIKPAVAMRMG